MKILLTGMTRMHVNGKRRREYNTSINALYHAMKAAKHVVEWRPLHFNEQKLDRYDLIVLGLGTISEFSCQYLYETLLASRQDNVLYLVNDWKANKTLKLLEEGDLFREFVLKNNSNHVEQKTIFKCEKLLEKCREKMFRRGDNLLGPFFHWGDRSIILNGTKFKSIYEFNPTAFYMAQWKDIEIPVRKKKQWVYGALNDYSKWHERLKLQWPVLAFNKKTFIPEPELVQHYAASHGMILPKYYASGSGWWRARFCHAMACENVMLADKKEWWDIAHDLHVDGSVIEHMNGNQLRELAEMQRTRIWKNTPRWSHVCELVDETLRRVIE